MCAGASIGSPGPNGRQGGSGLGGLIPPIACVERGLAAFEDLPTPFGDRCILEPAARENATLSCLCVESDHEFSVAQDGEVRVVRRDDDLPSLTDSCEDLDHLGKDVSVVEVIFGLIDEERLIACGQGERKERRRALTR